MHRLRRIAAAFILAALVGAIFSVEQLAQRAGVIAWNLAPVVLDDRITEYERADWEQPLQKGPAGGEGLGQNRLRRRAIG